jgi:hypothetical protein
MNYQLAIPTALRLSRPTMPYTPTHYMLAVASRCLVLMYKVAICHPSTQCYAISGTLFPIIGGQPDLPVPSPAAISLLLTSIVTTPGPLVGPARHTCNYPFPIPTCHGPFTKLH